MSTALDKAKKWLIQPFDKETSAAVQQLIDTSHEAVEEAFYKDLSFGTGGLRGIMGVGTNRINKYTIGAATQGLANYINQRVDKGSVAIAFDSRHSSDYFARLAAEILSANGIKAFLFEELRPTPQLSFAVRHLNCTAGIVITASHNPPEYNGYKVYWSDGGQLVPPQDEGVIQEVRKVSPEDVKFKPNSDLIEIVGKDLDEAYLDTLIEDAGTPGGNELSVVYTSIHGTGITMLPRALEKLGINEIHIVKEQEKPDGAFPTVPYPNPEEQEALQMALDLANEKNADILFGTDPDTDRIGVAAKDQSGTMKLLNGNQTASLLVAKALKDKVEHTSNPFIAKTIVTTGLLDKMAQSFDIPCYNTLTGFKWIAEQIRLREGKETFIGGGEESYGYLLSDAVRDKDAVMSGLYIAKYAAELKNEGKTLWDALIDLYKSYGFYHESLISITRKGKKGAEEIKSLMDDLRNNQWQTMGGELIASIADYQKGTVKQLDSKSEEDTQLPKSNVLQFTTIEGSVITVRPSGTEPKIKFYFSVNFPWQEGKSIDDHEKLAQEQIEKFRIDLNL